MRKSLIFFFKRQAGSVAVIFAVILPVVIILTGVSIDLYRVSSVNASLAYACDAAAVAGARYDAASASANALKVFYANFKNGTYGVTVTPTISATTDAAGVFSISVSAVSTMPTSFINFAGVPTLNVRALSAVKKNTQGLELALVLDVTGSMAGTKITQLRSSAASLINILYGSNNTRLNTMVSIVPFVMSVNIGNTRSAWLTQAFPACNTANTAAGADARRTQASSALWKGCVKARSSPNEENDAPPSVEAWAAYFSKSTYLTSLKPNSTIWDNDWSVDTACSVVTVNNPLSAITVGPNRGCGPAITSPINDKSALLSAVNSTNLQEVGQEAGTAGNLGLGWGWRTISPRWGNLWIAGYTPKNYDADNNRKVVVFMTDGQNNWFDGSNRPIGDQNAYSAGNPYVAVTDVTGTGSSATRVTGNTLNTAAFPVTSIGGSQDENALNNKMATVCNNIKNAHTSTPNGNPIKIYTIQFETSAGQPDNAAVKACATTPSGANKTFFKVPDDGSLATVFSDIANQLNVIQIIQ